MGGFFGVASGSDCVADLFYGTDYHSHLGTKRGGLAARNSKGLTRFIHNIVVNEYAVPVKLYPASCLHYPSIYFTPIPLVRHQSATRCQLLAPPQDEFSCHLIDLPYERMIRMPAIQSRLEVSFNFDLDQHTKIVQNILIRHRVDSPIRLYQPFHVLQPLS